MIEDANRRNAVASAYNPSPEVKDFTLGVRNDWSYGHALLTRTWVELNDRSVIDDENRGQLMFNAFVDQNVEDPGEAWKWRGTRSMARNKGIAMHAQIASQFLLPTYMAQNEEDEVDREFSEVMRDVVEWMSLPTNSNYQSSFTQVTMGMMTNPVTYMGAEFFEVMQQIKEKQEDGSYTKKEIVDEVLSGFQAPIYSSSQILITNAYQRNIQRQRRVIKRRFAEYAELKAKYQDHPNWQYVQKGLKTVYNVQDGLFYDIKDIQHPDLCEEAIVMDRRQDIEVPFVGGIYLGDIDSIENNPMCHRDNQGAPKYNLVPFGYSRIGEHFFYYKSMMNVVGWDHVLYDAMSEILMNRTILEVDQPLAVSGSDKIDSEIIFPKAVVAFEDEKTRVTPILPPSNLGAGYQALAITKQSMDQESLSDVNAGNMPGGSSKGLAYVLSVAQANAEKVIGEVKKSLADSLVQYGDLMKDIALNHITVPQVEELTGGHLRLKYRSFVLENKQIGGRTMHKKVMFDDSLIGAEMTDEERTHEALMLLEQSGWPHHKQALVRVNPELFAKFKYLSRIDIEEMTKQDKKFWQPILTNLYTMLAADPLIDGIDLRRRLMRSYFNSEGDQMVKDEAPAPAPGEKAPAAGGETPPPSNPLGAMAQTRALSTTLQPGAVH